MKQSRILIADDEGNIRLTVRVTLEAEGFEIEEVPDCLAEENLLRTSGRGLFLMRAFMDEFRVQKGFTGGAEVVMAKKLPHSISGNGKH